MTPARSAARFKLAPSIPMPQRSLRRPSPASATGHLPGSASRLARASVSRCSRDHVSLPQGSLAPVRVMLSRSISAYSDPIRQSRRHAAISRPCRLYATPSLCGSAEATHETFPTFTAVLSPRAADPTPAGPWRSPVVLQPRYQAPSNLNRVATHKLSVSASNSRRDPHFRRCIIRVMLRLVPLPGPPD